MARFLLFLLGVAALAVGTVDAYLAGAEHEKIVGRHVAERLSASTRSLPLALAADADLEVARTVAQRTPFHFTLADLAVQGGVPDRSVLEQAARSLRSLAGDAEPIPIVATRGGIRALIGDAVHELEGEASAIVRGALEGEERSGLAAIEGRLYRLRAVPVGTGALAVALPVDDAFARRLGERLGADLTFLHGGKAVASTLGTMERAELAVASSGAGGAFGTGSRPAEYRVFEVLELPLFVQWTGTTRALAQNLGDATILHSASIRPILDPLVELQKRSLLFSALVAVVAFFFAAVARSGKRQLRELAQLADVTERLAEGDATVVLPEHLAGDVGRMARAVQRLARGRRPNAVEAALAQTSFGEEKEEEQSVADLAAAFPFPAEPTEAGIPIPSKDGSEPAAEVERFGAADPAVDSEPGAGLELGPAAPEAIGLAQSVEHPVPRPDAAEPTGPVEFGRAVAPEPEPAAPAGFAMEPLEPGSGVEEARPAWDMPTRPLPLFPQPEADAKEPTESAPEEEQPEPLTAFLTPEPEEPAESEDPEEAHLREVYEQFLQVRQQCGESSAGISYERFAAKLRATRAQLMERHRSATVRFTVYVKDGKAALKASPVGIPRAS